MLPNSAVWSGEGAGGDTMPVDGMSPARAEPESAHARITAIAKRFIRLKLSGAWWKEETAENMLALRTLRANDDWEPYWSEVRQAAASSTVDEVPLLITPSHGSNARLKLTRL